MNPSVTTQQAGLAEQAQALGLLRRFFADEGFATSPEQLTQRLAVMLTSPELAAVYLAWQGNEAVGVATVTTSFGLEFGWSAELEDLYVLPTARGHGVAQALIAAAQDWCRRRDCSVMMVFVTPQDQASRALQRFYLARGFYETGRAQLLYDL